MLGGENGIITQVQNAKNKSKEAEIIEKIKMDIMDVQSSNNGKIADLQLIEILNKYFDDVPDTLPDDLATLTLTTKKEYGKYEIKVSNIYNGTFEIKSISIVNPYEDKIPSYTLAIGKINPDDVIAKLYYKENGLYDLVIEGVRRDK